jgi:hypothetical protein
LKCFEIIKFKRNLKTLIMISLFDNSSIVESFKIINLKKVIMISVLNS